MDCDKCKAVQADVDFWKEECVTHSDALCRTQEQLKDRDQEIERLKKELKGIIE